MAKNKIYIFYVIIKSKITLVARKMYKVKNLKVVLNLDTQI